MRTQEALLLLGAPPDAETWAGLCSDSVALRVGSRHTVIGRALAKAEFARLFANTVSLVDGFRAIWLGSDGATALMELEMTTTSCPDPVPLAIILRVLEPAPVVRDIRFYLDPAPLRLCWRNGDDAEPLKS